MSDHDNNGGNWPVAMEGVRVVAMVDVPSGRCHRVGWERKNEERVKSNGEKPLP